MKYETFSDTKEQKKPTQEELNETKDREFDEKIKHRGLLSVNEKQDLLKEARERTFSRGLPEGATKEEAEIKGELKKKENSELQPEGKAETDKVSDASENLNKELDDELHKYFSQQKEEQKNKLKKEMDALDERFDEIMEKTNNLEGDKKSEDFENQARSETTTEDKNREGKEQLRTDSIAERKKAMEDVKKLGESSGIDVSDAIVDI